MSLQSSESLAWMVECRIEVMVLLDLEEEVVVLSSLIGLVVLIGWRVAR